MNTKRMVYVLACMACFLCSGATGASAQAQSAHPATKTSGAVVLENELVRWEISAEGWNRRFVDKSNGRDYLAQEPPSCFALVIQAGQEHPTLRMAWENSELRLDFGETGVRAVIAVASEKRYFRLKVLSVEGGRPDELIFGNVPLTLKGSLDEPLAACGLALNLKTNVSSIPGPSKHVRASCYSRFGFEGAELAVVGCPQAVLRDVMKEVVSAAEELPHSSIGGPWALDAEISRGSYLFDFGEITEQTVDSWIAFTKGLGLNQIDFHTGGSLRFGDYTPNPNLFPNGRASVKAVLDKLHTAGIAAGLHTYAFFIAKTSPYVTPVPDPRLGKDAAFTLAAALAPDAATVPVVEPTTEMSAATGFFLRNSATLQIGDELITYAGVSKEPPYAFTGCQRGACGTKAAAHAEGTKVHHLKECFGLFTPDADSTLLAEVAANTADTFNECGFDMIYLDALDGEDILAGGENSWHYGSKFVFEIAKRLEKPALFEMSTFHHHLWYVRARMGAWDHPCRSHKRYVDLHCAANKEGKTMFLPMNLGWWAAMVWNDGPLATQYEPTFPDDIEYLMCKALGTDSGISLMGVNPGNMSGIPAFLRLAPIFKQYEELRHTGYFPESIKAELQKPGEEFTLEKDAQGKWQFRPVQYDKHKVQGIDGWSNQWTFKNRFAPQPVQLRIEALMTAAAYDAPESTTVEDFSNPERFADLACEKDVSASIESSTTQVKAGSISGCLTASGQRPNPNGAWAKIGRTFTPLLSIAENRGLGLWVYGDGQGELLNLQLKSPYYTGTGGIGDHYVHVDFAGWRYFELIEMEGGAIADFAWPYGGNAYGIYREPVDYGRIESLSIWYNLLPQGKTVTCYLSPIKALPLVKAKLRNPKVTLGGRTIVFPTELESGYYLEFRSMSDCTVYGPKGEVLSDITPVGDAPEAAAGENTAAFLCDNERGVSARAYVTLITRGEPLRE